MTPTITKATIIAEFEDNKVRQVIIDKNDIMKFLSAIAARDGALQVHKEPIEGITLEYNEK
jgi:hypothetical protein